MANGVIQTGRDMPYPAQIQTGRVESRSLPSTKNRNRELLRVKAHWIADIFPDELVIQEKTISVVRNEFLVSYVETMPVKDIGRVVYVNTPTFGGLRIIGKNTAHELNIKGLNKKAAVEAKEVIEGLLLEDAGVVDIPHWIQTEKRRDMLADAGRDPDNLDDLTNRAT
jgi:hypothetical protein